MSSLMRGVRNFTERYEEEIRSWITLLESLDESAVVRVLTKTDPMLQSVILSRSPKLKRRMAISVL